MLALLLMLQLLQLSSAESPASVVSTCCSQVFLSSSQQFADTNQQSLGIYTISSQKIANNPHPVYIKKTDHGDHFLYFRDKGNMQY